MIASALITIIMCCNYHGNTDHLFTIFFAPAPHPHPHPQVKNLRSAVSRAAIECLGDLFLHLKSSLEPHLEMVVKALLHRTGGANSFLREACEGTLRNMVLSVNHHKSLVALVTGGARCVVRCCVVRV